MSILFRGALSPNCCGANLLLQDLFAVELQLMCLLKVERAIASDTAKLLGVSMVFVQLLLVQDGVFSL